MSDNPADSKLLERQAFLLGIGKALSRFSLYSINHPLTQEAVKASFIQLAAALSNKQEMTISFIEKKIILDGAPASGLGATEQVLKKLFEKFQIQSFTFGTSVTMEELSGFYKLLTLKEDAIKDQEGIKVFFERENLKNIKLDTAFYARVSSDAKSGAGGGTGTGTGEGTGSSTEDGGAKGRWVDNLEEMPLDSMLKEIINKLVPDPKDQKKIYEIIVRQLQKEIKDLIQKATESLTQDKKVLVNEQGRTQSVINNIAEGTVVVDENGKIVMMNSAAEKICGASLSDLKGKPLSETSQEYLMITLSKDIINSPDKEFSKEVAVLSHEHTQDVIRNSTAMIQNPEGKIVGMISVLNDVAKQKELQRMQNDFLAHVTHELRSPLTSIKASLGTLFDEQAKLNPTQNQIMEIANRNIDRLARLINDLLDVTKSEAGKLTINPKPLDTAKIMRDAAASLESWAKSKKISLTCDTGARLPWINADPDRMTQVLVNLISNAIKFTPANGTIKLHAAPAGATYVRISVTDSGAGISKENQKKLFEKFSQLQQNEKSDTPGTGLGLLIAKQIVELHRGQIGIDSEPGKGSTFFLTIPVAQETKETQTQEPAPEQKKKSWLSRLFGR